MRSTCIVGESIADDDEQEKRIMHYSSNQKILLVGEGNFSFAACLAKAFGSATNMIATSLDSEVSVINNYGDAKYKLAELEESGCVILHEVDVYTMKLHPDLIFQLFDRIIYNFPHAGYTWREHDYIQIKLHQELVRGFLTSACKMLTEKGEIHVTHKTSYPFSQWEIVKLAEEVGLYLVEEASFRREDYPGYMNKKGSGSNCTRTFPVGQCSTYKFAVKLPLVKFSPAATSHVNSYNKKRLVCNGDVIQMAFRIEEQLDHRKGKSGNRGKLHIWDSVSSMGK